MPIQIEGRAARSESWVVRRRITESGALDSSLSFLNRFSAGKAVVAAARSQVSSYKPSGCVEQLHSFSRGWPHGPDYKLCNTTHKREWCYVFNKQIVFAKCKTCALVLNLWGGKVKNIKRRFTQHPSKLLHDASDWRCMWRRYLMQSLLTGSWPDAKRGRQRLLQRYQLPSIFPAPLSSALGK